MCVAVFSLEVEPRASMLELLACEQGLTMAFGLMKMIISPSSTDTGRSTLAHQKIAPHVVDIRRICRSIALSANNFSD